MRKFLSVLMFSPLLTQAQKSLNDSTTFRITQPYSLENKIGAVKEKNGKLIIQADKPTLLTMGGNYSFATGARSVNTFPYENSLFRTGSMTSHSILLKANIRTDLWKPVWAFSLKASHHTENGVMPDNHNGSRHLSATAERWLGNISVAGSYRYFSSHFSHDNSYGFLNHVYQDALQTQGSNPLLKDNGHFANRTQQAGNFSLQKKTGVLNFGISTSFDVVDNYSNQYTRRQKDDNISTNGWLSYQTGYGGSDFTSTAKINYIYNDEQVKIYYPADAYSYHRSSSDLSFTYHSIADFYDFKLGLNVGNKFYLSNTNPESKFFLPEVSGSICSNDFFDYRLYAKLTAGYSSFCSEPSFHHSYAPFLLTLLAPQDAGRYYPFAEVRSFNTISPMRQGEFSSSIELDYLHILNLRADYSIRDTRDNVFPVYENNQLELKNLADTRYKGLELELQFIRRTHSSGKIAITNSISFYKYSNTVTRVLDGYNFHPMAGFTTVHKALVKGQPVGVLVSNQPSIMGDPTPDYTLKFTHVLTWRAFGVNIDWEYRKGGDIWNGTEAVLEHGYTDLAGYIQKGDNIRIHSLSLAYDIKIKKYLQRIRLIGYVENLLLWSAYKGVDPSQLLYDQAGSAGLDFFNLPSTKTYGATVSLQF